MSGISDPIPLDYPEQNFLCRFTAGRSAAAVYVLILPPWTAGAFVTLGYFLAYTHGELARKQGRSSRDGSIFDAV